MAYNWVVPVGERQLLGQVELWPQERELCVKAAKGRLLDLRSHRPGQDDPARGREWGQQRQIRAQVLFQLLTGQGPKLAATVVAVRLRGAAIVGPLNLGGLTLGCPLELYACHLGSRLDLAKATAPNLSLRDSYLHKRLSARRLKVTHSLNLTGCFRCDGRVDLRSAHIGQLDCSGATLTNEGGEALIAAGLTVDGAMLLQEATVVGEVQLYDAHLQNLICEKATLSNQKSLALIAAGLTVGGAMLLRNGEVTGAVRLSAAHIGGDLDLNRATLTNPDDLAVDLHRASVTQAVHMRPAALQGGMDLTHARVGSWYDKKETWPDTLLLGDFVYESINIDHDTTVVDRIGLRPLRRRRPEPGWLDRHKEGYLPQPYEQLASVCRRIGHESAARRVEIAKQRARRADVRGWRHGPSVAWSAFLRWTIGYGYRPALALFWLLGLLALGWVLFDVAYPKNFKPANSSSTVDRPDFHPARYTADLLLPVVNFKQRDAFVAHGWAAWAAFGFTFAGWLLAAVVVAGLTGVFKRD